MSDLEYGLLLHRVNEALGYYLKIYYDSPWALAT
jgi:hypothetical protein